MKNDLDTTAGFYAQDISVYYSYIAYQYAKIKNAEKAFEALEESTRYSIQVATDEREYYYTAPMVNRLIHDPQNTSKNYKGNACNCWLEELGWDVYDFIREDERFKKIVRTLEEHAEQVTE